MPGMKRASSEARTVIAPAMSAGGVVFQRPSGVERSREVVGEHVLNSLDQSEGRCDRLHADSAAAEVEGEPTGEVDYPPLAAL
jgi:hypothetical protein